MNQTPNFNQLMQQLQRAQVEMTIIKEKLNSEFIEIEAGEGSVKVKMTGNSQMLGIKLDPAAVNLDDLETLEELIVTAVNDAIRGAAVLHQKRIGGLAGGLGLGGEQAGEQAGPPGMSGLPGMPGMPGMPGAPGGPGAPE